MAYSCCAFAFQSAGPARCTHGSGRMPNQISRLSEKRSGEGTLRSQQFWSIKRSSTLSAPVLERSTMVRRGKTTVSSCECTFADRTNRDMAQAIPSRAMS